MVSKSKEVGKIHGQIKKL